MIQDYTLLYVIIRYYL